MKTSKTGIFLAVLAAARTGAYYAVAPFIGVLLSLAVFREAPPATFYIALAAMAGGIAESYWASPTRS